MRSTPPGPTTWRGPFATRKARLVGEIDSPHPGAYDIFILNLPHHLRNHQCFSEKGAGRWKMHMHHTPRSLDHAIRGAERELEKVL